MALTKVSTNVVDMSGNTGGLVIAKGTTAQQETCNPPTTNNLGSIRENTTENKVEVCTSTGWQFLEEAGTVLPDLIVDYLVVAGGGGTRGDSPGGGGAGGLRTSYGTTSGGGSSAESAITLLPSTVYTLTVGNGTNGSTTNTGENSVFDSITSYGGGRGGGSPTLSNYPGFNGGSGGGGSGGQYGTAAGTGTTNQGFAGGISQSNGYPFVGGGGGGAGAVGLAGTSSAPGGNGGIGVAVNILPAAQAATLNVGEVDGSDVYYAGGGGGSLYNSPSTTRTGGLGGGGDGTSAPPNSGNAGTPNTGGGAGGVDATGGSGVVIIKYPSGYSTSKTGNLVSSTFTNVPGYNIEVFTSGSGTITFA